MTFETIEEDSGEEPRSPARRLASEDSGILELRPPTRLESGESLGVSATSKDSSIKTADPGIQSLAPPRWVHRTGASNSEHGPRRISSLSLPISVHADGQENRIPQAEIDSLKDPRYDKMISGLSASMERTVSEKSISSNHRLGLGEGSNKPRMDDSMRSSSHNMSAPPVPITEPMHEGTHCAASKTKEDYKDRMFRGKVGCGVHAKRYYLPCTFLIFAVIGLSVTAALGQFSPSSSSPASLDPVESMSPSLSPVSDMEAPQTTESQLDALMVKTPSPTPARRNWLRTRRN